MKGGSLSFQRSWEGFLPPNTVIMAKRRAGAEGVPVGKTDGFVPTSAVRLGFEASDLAEPASRELLDKIIAALDLPSADYAVFSTSPEEIAPAILVRFAVGESEAARAGVWEGGVLTTFSLRAMLGNPGLKKPVWAHLKDAVERGRG